jgi:tRNA (cmo5U34)-methyltransferase
MRHQAAARLSAFGSRARVEPFDLYNADDWRSYLAGADCVVSSLVVHHLDGAEKQRLFAVIGESLSARGALLIADLIHPQRPEAGELFAATWDQSVKETLTLVRPVNLAQGRRFCRRRLLLAASRACDLWRL